MYFQKIFQATYFNICCDLSACPTCPASTCPSPLASAGFSSTSLFTGDFIKLVNKCLKKSVIFRNHLKNLKHIMLILWLFTFPACASAIAGVTTASQGVIAVSNLANPSTCIFTLVSFPASQHKISCPSTSLETGSVTVSFFNKFFFFFSRSSDQR